MAKRLISVARVGDLAPGDMMRIVVAGEPVLLANIDGAYRAVQDTCTHEEGSLSEGYLEDGEVECPLHGARFDLETGAVRALPAVHPLRTFDVVVEKDEIKIRVP